MEIKEMLKDNGIIGVISSYKSNLDLDKVVKDLNINNIDKALKMVGLDENYKDKKLSDLTLPDLWKVELATKLNNEIIIMGNLSQVLNYKELEYFKKLFVKLNSYGKKIVVIDNNVKVFFNLVKKIIVLKDKDILYETDNFFDMNLYNYTKCPKIVDFIKYVNKDNKRINETTDIYELIKDIYRSVS